MLAATSQLLCRSSELFSHGRWLLVNPADKAIFSQFTNSEIYGFHQYFDIYQQCQLAQPNRHFFAPAISADQHYDGIVIYMPKAKQQLKMLLANAVTKLHKNGLLLLVGENNSGVKSAAKLMSSYGNQVNKLDSARHCALFAVEYNGQAKAFDLDNWLLQTQVQINACSFPVLSLPGVFSHGELDAGTSLLLHNSPVPKQGKVLDFACGAGVIGCYLAQQNPAIELVMSDVSALAVYSAEQTAKLNGVTAQVVAANGLSGLANDFAYIYTNPPFHTGIKTDYSVTENFINSSVTHMTAKAQLLLVANRFLPYPDLLQQRFAKLLTLAQSNKFNLYQCVRT